MGARTTTSGRASGKIASPKTPTRLAKASRGVLVVGLAVAMALFAATAQTGQAKEAGSSGTIQGIGDCGSCHTTQSASLDDESTLAGMHAAFVPECTQCHSDEALVETHKDADAEKAKKVKKLKKTSIDPSVCFSCHDEDKLTAGDETSSQKETGVGTSTCGSAGTEASKNATPTIVDKEGTAFNPHAIPDIEQHEKIVCGSCHSMHDSQADGVGASAQAAATKLCSTCHHEGVYRACNTCHDA